MERFDFEGLVKKYPDAPAVRVFNRITNDAEDTGVVTFAYHSAVMVLKESGIRDYSTLRFDYDPLCMELFVDEVTVHHKDGKTTDVPLDTLRDIAGPAWIIFWGVRSKVLNIPGLKVGDTVECKYHKEGFQIAYLGGAPKTHKFIPPMAGHFYDIVMFQESIPIEEMSYKLVCPREKPVRASVYNSEMANECTFEADKLIYQWSKKDIPAFKDEKNMVSFTDVAPKLVYASLRNWSEKSAWFYGVNEPCLIPDNAIIAKTEEIIKDAKDEEEKIYRLVHWVAENVRYVGLTMGKGEGYTTHPVTMTFHERGGVCKDKAGLLVSMLRIAGIDSYVVITMAGAKVEPIPADQFNHAVSCIRRPDGTFRYLDPTWAPRSRELWSSAEQLQAVIPGVKEGVDMELSPYSPPANNYLNMKFESKVEDTALRTNMKADMDGAPDSHYRRIAADGLPPYLRRHMFERFASAMAPGSEVVSHRVSDPLDFSAPLGMECELVCPGLAALASGNKRLVRPAISAFLAKEAFYHRVMDSAPDAERNFPMRFRSTGLYRFEETIDLAGADIVSLPENISASCPVASVKATFTRKGRSVRVSGEFSLIKREFPKEDYAEFRKVASAMRDLCDSFVTVKI